MGGSAVEVPAVPDSPSTLSAVARRRDVAAPAPRSRERPRGARRLEARGSVRRRHPRGCKKGGPLVARTRRGPATKIVAVADGSGLPLAVTIADGNRGEASLVEEALNERFCRRQPKRLIGDKAYDSTKLDQALKKRHIELISPQIRAREGTRRSPSRRRQDGRPLRRYRRRWKIERLWAWLLRFRRVTTRYEVKATNFLAFVHVACAVLLLRRLAGL